MMKAVDEAVDAWRNERLLGWPLRTNGYYDKEDPVDFELVYWKKRQIRTEARFIEMLQEACGCSDEQQRDTADRVKKFTDDLKHNINNSHGFEDWKTKENGFFLPFIPIEIPIPPVTVLRTAA